MFHLLLCGERRADLLLLETFLSDLERDPRVDWAPDYEAAYDAISGPFDACLVDVTLGGGRGLEVLHALAARRPQIPALALIPDADEALEHVAIDAGAAAVLVRSDLAPRMLERTLRHVIARHRLDYTLERPPSTDAVVPVSVALDRVELSILRARRKHGTVAVLSIDLSTHGDEGLGHVDQMRFESCLVARLCHVAGGRDRVSRLGPGELVVASDSLPDLDAAVTMVTQIERALRQPVRIGTRSVAPQASVGMSCYPQDSANPMRLVAMARAASIRVPETTGVTTLPPPSVGASERARRHVLRRSIAGAAERGEWHVMYQPQIDLRHGTTVGVEALLRWNHPELGPVSPGEFVSVAEETGQVPLLGRFVLDTACRQAHRWWSEGQPLRVAVNVSAQELSVGVLADEVKRALFATGLPPSLLLLEITEGLLLENSAETRAQLMSLRDLGVKIAVDDFGTGYASLSYVKQFPMDAVKIDREFVRDLHLDVENAAITSSIVALGRCLGLEVVAEGVEHEGEEAFLRSVDCHVVQGYRYAFPMTAVDLASFRVQQPPASQSGTRFVPDILRKLSSGEG